MTFKSLILALVLPPKALPLILHTATVFFVVMGAKNIDFSHLQLEKPQFVRLCQANPS